MLIRNYRNVEGPDVVAELRRSCLTTPQLGCGNQGHQQQVRAVHRIILTLTQILRSDDFGVGVSTLADSGGAGAKEYLPA